MDASDFLLPEQTRRFKSWEEARGVLQPLNGSYVFRGMSNAAWILETTLDRLGREVEYSAPEAEEVLVDSFQKTVPKDSVKLAPDDRLSWLALMRHYGLPSRLLDCTESYEVAAYFAATTEDQREQELAIWAFEKDAVQRAAKDVLGLLGKPPSPRELGTKSLFSAAFSSPMQVVALVDASEKSERQQAQKGLFLCPGDAGRPFWWNFPKQSADEPDFLYRIVLPPSARREIQADLASIEIDYANLLPDRYQLEGLCRTLREKLKESQMGQGYLKWQLEVRPVALSLERGVIDLNLNSASPQGWI
jgi:hypothetical protein